MSVDELNQNELEELRECFFHKLHIVDSSVLDTYKSADDIPMSNVKAHYEGVYFVKEDFFCNLTDC